MNMTTLTIFTSMTNPDARHDAWKEALDCYESLADEVIIVGKDWPNEFKPFDRKGFFLFLGHFFFDHCSTA